MFCMLFGSLPVATKLVASVDNALLFCRRESHGDALQEKTADQMSIMYIQTVEAELRKFRCRLLDRSDSARAFQHIA